MCARKSSAQSLTSQSEAHSVVHTHTRTHIMWKSSCIALLLSLLLFWCSCVEGRPFLGLLSLLAGGGSSSDGNSSSSSLLETLAFAHLNHKLAKLQLLSDLLSLGGGGDGGNGTVF